MARQAFISLDVEAGDYERSGVEFAALLRQAREEPNALPLLAEVKNLEKRDEQPAPDRFAAYSCQ
jgi:hypothetical protein